MSLVAINFGALPVWVNSLVILGTITLLAVGAYYVVESATRIAQRLHVSELVIGLTVVAFGTSAPEFAVTLNSAFRGYGDISVGNIVGSNIFNLGFILGGCALVRTINTSAHLLRRDGTILIVSSVLLLGLIVSDLTLSHLDGALLFLLFAAYLFYLFRSRKALPSTDAEERARVPEPGRRARPLLQEWLLLIVGLACIVYGSHLLVGSSTALAKTFGVSEWVIGVTVVAVATSVPELVVSLVAILKHRHGISVGNIIGSSIFNVLGVLGLAGILRPVGVDPMARFSLAALAVMVLVLLVFIRTGWRISRLEGVALLVMATVMWVTILMLQGA